MPNEESMEADILYQVPVCLSMWKREDNSYAVFTELNRNQISDDGRKGCIVPTGIAVDDTTKYFFQDLTKTKTLVSLFDFENNKRNVYRCS